MSLKVSAIVAVLAAASLGYAARSFQPGQAPSKEDMIAAMKQMAAPAEEHKVLEGMAGEFAMTGKATMMPGMELEWKGTEKARMILGGRFLEADFVTDADEKFQVNGKSVMGYDTRTKKYTIWGIDTLGTYSVSAEGDYDAAKKTLTLSGVNKEAGMEMKFKYVFTMVDEKTRTMDILFDIPGMGWQKQVETKCVKK